ncbi:hypothetical protein GGQ86_002957 [Xanthobacter flavus]|uniref:Uncharacterized protein n=1 Tax=Xanthobacter flavus TaxID=281 RepID=A0A9W6FKN9_XANFL|nr:hypothetical protein [Xanthobacter flavus]MDR6334475.1 hypothetical protein [Xanthobacter flavus]GLI23505.1 hypothetical protein XFLAVUS301_31790 [Xanthobacter flavus]
MMWKIVTSPLTWAIVAGAVLIGGVWWLAENRYAAGADAGRAEIRAEWTAANLQAEQDRRAAERRVEEKATAAAKAHAAEIEKTKADAQEMIDAYRADLAARPAEARCALTPDDVRRLRDIAAGRRTGK